MMKTILTLPDGREIHMRSDEALAFLKDTELDRKASGKDKGKEVDPEPFNDDDWMYIPVKE